jgi:predicted ATP-dependent endonuclease of OLD family
MIITNLSVRNLRCLRSVDIPIDPLTALLGRNGAGKSCILHAIGLFYDTAASVSEEDFYNRDTTRPIEITVTYGHLHPDELDEFSSYVSNAVLIVTKRISVSDDAITQKYYASTPQLPRFAELRAIPGTRERISAWNALVDSATLEGLQRARSGADVEASMRAHEAAQPDQLVLVEREAQFFGPANIGGGKLDSYTKFLLIPAVKDVADELTQRRGASLYQLLDLIVLRRIEAREDIADRRADIQEQAKELYRRDNLPELAELGSDISTLLGKFSPGARLVLDWDEPSLPELPLPSPRPRLVEDEFEGDIDKKGHGLQRALLMTLLQYLAQLKATVDQEAPSTDEEQEQRPPAAQPSPSLILAIEEPELYLHPLRARYLAALFSELTRPSPDGTIYTNQIIFSSHSPFFVDLPAFEAIRIIRKQRPAEAPAAETHARCVPIAEALREMARIAQLPPEEVTVESFKAHMIPAMNYAASEGFFADAILLVEGLGEAGIFSTLQRLLGRDWASKGLAIVPIEGKNKLDRPAIVFRGLGIPTFVLFDGDKHLAGTPDEQAATRTNRLLLRLVNAAETDFPQTQVKDSWAVFEHNTEHELQLALGKHIFEDLRSRVAAEFAFQRPSQVLKSPHCASGFISLAYREGHKVPVLEAIVEAVSKLVA